MIVVDNFLTLDSRRPRIEGRTGFKRSLGLGGGGGVGGDVVVVGSRVVG